MEVIINLLNDRNFIIIDYFDVLYYLNKICLMFMFKEGGFNLLNIFEVRYLMDFKRL